MIKELCIKCGSTLASHALYGCCAEPLESSLSCGNSYRKCAECTGDIPRTDRYGYPHGYLEEVTV